MTSKKVTTLGLGLVAIAAAMVSSNLHAQTTVIDPIVSPVAVPASVPTSVPGPVPGSDPTSTSMPVPVPVIAQTQETLSARTLVRLEQLARELAETIGRVEALEAAAISQKSENERLIALVDAAKASPARVDTMTTVTDGTVNSAVSDRAVDNVASDAAMFTAPMPPPLAPSIMLINAQTALQSGGYNIAEANLTQLIWVHPTSPEASEGRWLLGEARYVQSSWGTSAQAYVEYLKASPQGPRAAEALLRLAGAFRQLNDNRQRCLALAEFKRRAPRPDATLKARADGEIARMACPAA